MARVPVLARAGVQRIVNGPITYTPDGNPLLGSAFGLPGLLARLRPELRDHAGGRCWGATLAEWIVEGQPSIDLWELDPRALRCRTRPSGMRSPAASTSTRTSTRSSTRKDDRRPGGRPRTSQLYDRFRAAGAVFGVRNGWERPYWFAPAGHGATRSAELPPDELVRRRSAGRRALSASARSLLSSRSFAEVRGPRAGRGGACSTASARTRLPRPRPDRPLPAARRHAA